MKKIVLVNIILVLCFSGLTAQEKQHRHLSLEESIEIAKEQSFTMLRLQQNLKQAEYNLQSATRRLKTHIDLTLNLPTYSDQTKEWSDTLGISYYSEKQLGYDGNLRITQPLPTDGSIYVENNLSSIVNMRRDQRSSFARTRIGIDQPLDAFYGYNNIRSTLKTAELNHERSSKSLKREELNLVYNVSNSYYNLLQLQERANIAAMDLARQKEAYELSKNKYAAGLIREVDALQMEVDLAGAQSSYDMALLNQESSINRFKELLGISLEDSISLGNDLKYEVVIIDPDLAISYALENRLEIREQDIQIELQRLNIKRQKAEGMPKANLNAYYEQSGVFQDYDETLNNYPGQGATTKIKHRKEVFASIGSAYSNYSDRPASVGVGFRIVIPILDWGENRSRVRAAESQLKEYEYTKDETERSIRTEVKNLVANINSNLRRLQLLEKNVTVAEKSFEITRQRYADGDINSESLALERNRLNTAYTTRLDAFINYQLSLADLMRKTFYDFQKQMPIE